MWLAFPAPTQGSKTVFQKFLGLGDFPDRASSTPSPYSYLDRHFEDEESDQRNRLVGISPDGQPIGDGDVAADCLARHV